MDSQKSFAQRSHLHPPPPPPPPPPPNNSNLNIKAPIPISFSNGNSVLKKRRRHHHRRRSQESLYRECLRNHAASLGGHALDGCGEFMPSPSSSLTCAACGCHRNFHRRFPSSSHPFPSSSSSSSSSTTSSSDDGEEHEDNLYGHSSSDLHVPSAPSMLMAFLPAAPPPPPPRKRFRTRFSSEQKERMQELSERLGWRLHKRDDKLVEESCREMGVRRGVFKVWMHNNKHNFRPPQPPRRSTSPTVNTAVTPSTATVGI